MLVGLVPDKCALIEVTNDSKLSTGKQPFLELNEEKLR